MNRRIIVLLFVNLLSILCCACGKRTPAETKESTMTNKEVNITNVSETEDLSFDKSMEMQKTAMEANEKLHSSFSIDESGNVYPEDYAGTYLDGELLYVLSVSEDRLKEYKELLKDYDCVKYRLVDNSYNELVDHLEYIVKKNNTKYHIYEYEVDVKNNRGKLFVSNDEDYQNLKENLKDDKKIIVEMGYEPVLE